MRREKQVVFAVCIAFAILAVGAAAQSEIASSRFEPPQPNLEFMARFEVNSDICYITSVKVREKAWPELLALRIPSDAADSAQSANPSFQRFIGLTTLPVADLNKAAPSGRSTNLPFLSGPRTAQDPLLE